MPNGRPFVVRAEDGRTIDLQTEIRELADVIVALRMRVEKLEAEREAKDAAPARLQAIGGGR